MTEDFQGVGISPWVLRWKNPDVTGLSQVRSLETPGVVIWWSFNGCLGDLKSEFLYPVPSPRRNPPGGNVSIQK